MRWVPFLIRHHSAFLLLFFIADPPELQEADIHVFWEVPWD